MNPKSLKNNEELYQYLLNLITKLNSVGEKNLAKKVEYAGEFFTGSSSEFLMEVESALVLVKNNFPKSLPAEMKDELHSVLNQIRIAFEPKG